jgi:hypothetical protein
VVEGALACDEIKRAVREGKLFSIPTNECGVSDLFLRLVGESSPYHFRCQIDTACKGHARSERQGKRSRPAGNVEQQIRGLGLGEFNLLRHNFRRIAYRDSGERLGGFGKLSLDSFFVFFGHRFIDTVVYKIFAELSQELRYSKAPQGYSSFQLTQARPDYRFSVFPGGT